MTFTKSNTVKQMILDTVAKLGGMPASMVHWNTRLSGLVIAAACDAMYASVTIVTCLGQRPCCIGTRAQGKRHTSVVRPLRSLILCALPSSINSPGLTRVA